MGKHLTRINSIHEGPAGLSHPLAENPDPVQAVLPPKSGVRAQQSLFLGKAGFGKRWAKPSQEGQDF